MIITRNWLSSRIYNTHVRVHLIRPFCPLPPSTTTSPLARVMRLISRTRPPPHYHYTCHKDWCREFTFYLRRCFFFYLFILLYTSEPFLISQEIFGYNIFFLHYCCCALVEACGFFFFWRDNMIIVFHPSFYEFCFVLLLCGKVLLYFLVLISLYTTPFVL